MNSRRSWLVFAVAMTAYFVAVLHRTSLGVAAVEATERFGVTAAALSSLAVVQLVVYAALQVPVGVMIDRVGPRFLIVVGAALMCIGQAVLALAPSIEIAVLGRVGVGAGDAMTFLSCIRLLATWFEGKTLPIVTQVLGTGGQVGQILSALPLVAALHTWGWEWTYLGIASLSVIVIVVVLVAVQGKPRTTDSDVSWGASLRQLRESLSRPGTQLGFWSHFVSQPSVTMFSLLWGFPFLSIGLGYGPEAAALLLTLVVVVAAVSGPILGLLSARFPLRRSSLVLGIVAAMGILWALVLLWPGAAPVWLIVALVVAIAVGGPGSLIGFDFARTFNPLRSMGSATGVVNAGGFTASFTIMLLVGFALDEIDRVRGGTGIPAELYSLDSFRIAFVAQYLVIGFGVVMLLRARRRTRARLHEEEGITVAPLWVVLVRRWRRREK
ncbi:MFS family permease [Microbacteriaceae bacterium SG_E_30_P1]|uniref:MFS family permease n=1 Tax=Antiquaquibacter oligotrophicus TaxID=2880260 RepID=A0ABT6KM11_9MICO|nr:MFS transporter [Antiquaquibacter oligotrophicus]MDH6181050.1 MFS family permease [Antiquaquibacter oligotrophicus]UDF13252.1 MFS transporter [Antiquaquibacter oligotrophicus]